MTRYDVDVEHNVSAAMRDGVILRSDVYRPKDEAAFPVLLCRTPYGKTRRKMHRDIGNEMASRGYIVTTFLYSGFLQWFIVRNYVKILAWDRTGFALYAKRLERGRFRFPSSAASQEISEQALRFLLDGIPLGGRHAVR